MRSLVRSFHILQHEHPSPTPSLQPNVTQIQNSRQEREQGPIPARRAEAAAGVHFQGVEDGGEGHDVGRVRGDPPAVEGLVDVGWFNLCVCWLWSVVVVSRARRRPWPSLSCTYIHPVYIRTVDAMHELQPLLDQRLSRGPVP